MANSGIWSALIYHAVIDNIEVTARIPQSALRKDGTIKKQVADLIKNPCLVSRRKLLVLYKTIVKYRPLSPVAPAMPNTIAA